MKLGLIPASFLSIMLFQIVCELLTEFSPLSDAIASVNFLHKGVESSPKDFNTSSNTGSNTFISSAKSLNIYPALYTCFGNKVLKIL